MNLTPHSYVLYIQGGHPDGLRVRVPCQTNPPQLEIVKSVTNEIQVTKEFDSFVREARDFFANLISLPIAWIYLCPTIKAFKKHKQKRVREGTETVKKLQTYRTSFLDFYFGWFTFCGEEEFYLLVLPTLFWNGDFMLAYRLTAVATGGLIGMLLYICRLYLRGCIVEVRERIIRVIRVARIALFHVGSMN